MAQYQVNLDQFKVDALQYQGEDTAEIRQLVGFDITRAGVVDAEIVPEGGDPLVPGSWVIRTRTGTLVNMSEQGFAAAFSPAEGAPSVEDKPL